MQKDSLDRIFLNCIYEEVLLNFPSVHPLLILASICDKKIKLNILYSFLTLLECSQLYVGDCSAFQSFLCEYSLPLSILLWLYELFITWIHLCVACMSSAKFTHNYKCNCASFNNFGRVKLLPLHVWFLSLLFLLTKMTTNLNALVPFILNSNNNYIYNQNMLYFYSLCITHIFLWWLFLFFHSHHYIL